MCLREREERAGVNFINVIRAKNLYESLFLAAFSSYVLALAKNLYKKCTRETLMKSTPGQKCIEHVFVCINCVQKSQKFSSFLLALTLSTST